MIDVTMLVLQSTLAFCVHSNRRSALPSAARFPMSGTEDDGDTQRLSKRPLQGLYRVLTGPLQGLYRASTEPLQGLYIPSSLCVCAVVVLGSSLFCVKTWETKKKLFKVEQWVAGGRLK